MRNSLRTLRHSAFRRALTASGLSQFGSQLSVIAIAFAVLDASNSASALGGVLAARTLPGVLLLLVGGLLADRYRRHSLMISSDLVSGFVQLTLAVILIAAGASLWYIVIGQVLLGSGTAFFNPAAAGFVQSSVPEEELQAANSLLGLVNNSATLIGPAVSGVIVAVLGAPYSILVDAMTFFGSAALIASLPRDSRPPAKERSAVSVRKQLAEGWDEVRRRRWLGAGIAQGMMFQAGFAAFFTLGPVIMRRDLGGAGEWGVVVTAFGAGAVFGGLSALRWRVGRPLLVSQAALAVTTPVLVALASHGSVWVLAPATFVAGAGFALCDILWESAVQADISADHIGRVVAFITLGTSSLRPLGYAVAGGLAAAVGMHFTLWLVAGVLLASVPLSLLSAPSILSWQMPSTAATDEPGPAAPALVAAALADGGAELMENE